MKKIKKVFPYLISLSTGIIIAGIINNKKRYKEIEIMYKNKQERKKSEIEKLRQEMEKAIKNEEFKVYLQPKMDVKTEKIVGAEALVRWDKQGNLIPPDKFIPQFEKYGFITKLDNYVLEQVCKKQNEWKTKGYRPITISINESKRHLFNSTHRKELLEMTKKYQVDPKYIELELTERSVISNIEKAKIAEKSVHELGFIVSMDDFGTGYSSFSMLKNINIDVLKMDKTFFDEIIENQRGRTIIEAIVKMCKDLKIVTVAEGIETKEQLDYLKHIGCDMAQGYYFSKPIPMQEFELKWLNPIEKIDIE